ncbi:Putative mitochondrial outer membrane protein OM14 [Septoria linicola]|uniref:Mitochondrial outer membrane protein OM14 n=1 Tax=Septoria linicola TaxID=215465 RepID=A0A9Q9AQD1_9PEZI|nr:putative mitochondrial outer membrane protein OM14 [Septoria linicola]USW50293.1 Putative mitochondrial outer membrane protein OM14 [Septoria linicola]
MSYAQAAAPHGKSQKQTDEEKMPDFVPEIMHEDSGVHSLESLNSTNEHLQSLPSDSSYAGQQEAEERAEEIRRQGKQAAGEIDKEARDFMNAAEKSANDLKSDAKKDGKKLEKKAEAEFEKAKGKAQEGYGKAKKEGAKVAKEVEKDAKKAGDWAEKNQNNPVVLGNAVAIAGLATLLGAGAYRAHKANTLTWNVVGAWAGVVGLFAVGDYYVSQYFFKKYPPKN